MGILSRYVFRQTAGALVLILLSLTGVVWIAVALRQLELMTTQGQDVVRFLAMTSLAIPSMMALIAPIALLIASIHVINRLNSDSELIVMTSGGMPAWSLLKPLLLLGFLVSVGVSCVNHAIGPWAQNTLKDLVVQVRTDLMSQIIQPWRFTSPEAKLTVHIRDRAPTGELLGLMMHDARDPKQVVTYLAERAFIIKQEGRAYLRMDKGHIVRRIESEPAPQIIAFVQYAVDANELEQRTEQIALVRPRQRYTSDLLAPDPNDAMFKSNPGSFTSELHERFVSPFYCLTFMLIVVAFMGQARTTRTSRLKTLIAAFAAGVTCRVAGIMCANMVAVRPWLAPMLYAVPLAASLAAVIAIQWHLYPRRTSRLGRIAEDLGSGLRRGLAALRPAPAASRMRG